MNGIDLDALQALAPCPFCGCTPTLRQIDDVIGIECGSECDKTGLTIMFPACKADTAIAAWNRRADTGNLSASSLQTSLECTTTKSADAAKWTDGSPDNLPAASLDALLWLQYTQTRSKLLGMSVKDWGRLGDCIEALQGFLPAPSAGRVAPEGGKALPGEDLNWQLREGDQFAGGKEGGE